MKSGIRKCLLCLLCVAEPVCHVLGVPHPEGLSAQAANLLVTWEAE